MKKQDPYIEQALIRLLEEHSLDKISVAMVCEECHISRQTLYYHYDSLMDVFCSWARTGVIEEMQKCDNYHVWTEGFRSILTFAQAYRSAFMHVFESSYRKELVGRVGEFGRELVAKAVDDVSSDFNIPIMKRDKDFMVKFYMDVFMGILMRYARGGMNEDPDYIVSRCEVMMGHSIRNAERELYGLYK